MVNIVAVLICAQTARQLTQQILLAQQLEEADEVGMGSLERLVQQGAALLLGTLGIESRRRYCGSASMLFTAVRSCCKSSSVRFSSAASSYKLPP